MHALMDEFAAAEVFGLHAKTLRRWRWEGKGPAYCKVGGAVRYRPSDLEAFVTANMVLCHG